LIIPGNHIDKELLLRVAKGDELAFRAVYDFYKARFHAAAFKMTRSADDAEEIVQEVFITLWNQRTKVGGAQNPVNYFYKILHNTIYSHFRKLAHERQLKLKVAGNERDADESPVEERLIDKEELEILEAVITQLPPQQQLVYRLSKQQGLTREQIAEKLKISPNTVKNHLAVASEFVREHVKKGLSALIWAVIWTSL
jgi:RNA polymerase sigma-70 factor (ECF subfamily)